MTSGSVRGIDIHDNRKKEFSHTNQDIDFSKSENNYKLKESEQSFYNSVQERIKALELPKAVRKDAVVMSQALVTSDKAFFDRLSQEQQEDFFKKSYEFLENRYGKENIISATVHLDEKTPHMHVNFVPVTSDHRLCAKDLLNRKEMQSLQNDAYREVFKPFGLERGEIREDKRKHLTTEQYKLEITSKELEITSKDLQRATKRLEEIKTVTLVKAVDKEAPTPSKTIMGREIIDFEEYEKLRKQFNERNKEYYKLANGYKAQEKDISGLKRELSDLDKTKIVQENKALRREITILKIDSKELKDLKPKHEQLQKNLNWYKDFYDDSMKNLKGIPEKDIEWLKANVFPKWSIPEVAKDIIKVLKKTISQDLER